MSDYSKKSTTIWLPYFKQGDDLGRCIEKDDNGNIMVKQTISNHILLLESSIDQLKEINNLIPEINNYSIYGDTHNITITGDERFINNLVNKGLATDIFEMDSIDQDLEELSDDEYSDNESSDNEIKR